MMTCRNAVVVISLDTRLRTASRRDPDANVRTGARYAADAPVPAPSTSL
jgi:hypothetical protein